MFDLEHIATFATHTIFKLKLFYYVWRKSLKIVKLLCSYKININNFIFKGFLTSIRKHGSCGPVIQTTPSIAITTNIHRFNWPLSS